MSTIIAIGVIAGYGFVAGITYALAYYRAAKRESRTPEAEAVVPAAFWPFGLPVLAGVVLVERINSLRIPRAVINKESRHV